MRSLVKLGDERSRFFCSDFAFKGINCLAVGTGCHCNVIKAFHAAFYFKRINAGFFHVVKMVNHAEVFGREYSRKVFAFKNGEMLVGALLFSQVKTSAFSKTLCVSEACVTKLEIPAACVAAETAVRTAPRKIGAHEAAPRVRDAHRAVRKNFKLHFRNGVFYFTDFCKACFSSKNNPAEAEFVIHFHCFSVNAVSLCAEMQARIREVFLNYRNHSDILDYKRINRVGPEKIEVRKKVVYVFVMKAYVQRAEKLFIRIFCFERLYFVVFIAVKIICLNAEREFL